MNDYSELVKALRDDNACLSIKTAHEAADAIEQLRDETPSNADRIRVMSDEELAFYIFNHPMWTDEKTLLEWLKSPVEVDV